MSKRRRCECCGKKVRLMCQDRFCGGRCETRKCDHPRAKQIVVTMQRGTIATRYTPKHATPEPKNGARF